MKLYIHPYIFYEGRYGGIARYVCELASQHEEMGVNVHIPIEHTENIYLHNAPFFARTSAATPPAPLWLKVASSLMPTAQLRKKATRYQYRYQALKALQKNSYDLVHPSYTNATEIIPHLGKMPLVITVHDMIHELYPGAFAANDPTASRKAEFIKRADRIIAISHKTKEDLINICGVDSDKVDVVYHGNSLVLPNTPADTNIALPQRYILFVGHRFGYKNFDTLLKAFAHISRKEKDLYLICAGGPEFSMAELRQMQELGIKEKIQRRPVSDEDLALMYNRALCFIYPSGYEGFGLPILEAYACGTPVICAHASCFPEIAADGALYFQPDKVDELVDTIETLLHSDALREKLLAAAAQRLAHFSWQKCAKETLAVYNKVLS